MSDASLAFNVTGDAQDGQRALDQLADSADNAATAVDGVGDAATDASSATDQQASSTADATTRMAKLGAIMAGAEAAIAGVAGGVQALADITDRAKQKELAHERALIDVEQASADAAQAVGDLNQAQLDLAQSAIDATQAEADVRQARLDAKQAALDARVAQADYTAAVREYGAGSAEAQQAALDLAQAQNDAKQAGIDGKQAELDLKQATEDGNQAKRDGNQAMIDARDAQLRLTEAQREANPPMMTAAAADVQAYAGVVSGLVGTVGVLAMAYEAVNLATIKSTASLVAHKIASAASAVWTGIQSAAQWILNAAFWACPVTWIVAAVLVLIGVIVLIATKTTWFQTAWSASWGFIKGVGLAIGRWFAGPFKNFFVGMYNWIIGKWNSMIGFFKSIPGKVRGAFSSMWNGLKTGFRSVINWIVGKWNSLRFTVPSVSIPGLGKIGGFTIGVPSMPYLARGGTITGAGWARVGDRGPEDLYLPRGARVEPLSGGRSAATATVVLKSDGGRMSRLLIELLREAISDKGGDVVTVLS